MKQGSSRKAERSNLFTEFFVEFSDVLEPLFAQFNGRNDLAVRRMGHDAGDYLIVAFSYRQRYLEAFSAVDDEFFRDLAFMPFLLYDMVVGRLVNTDHGEFRTGRLEHSEAAFDIPVDF